jgi:hypothetical protein
VQGNHLGGKQHLAWFTMPFCDRCHPLFHAMVDRAGIDLRYTDDPVERVRRALAAIKIAEWMLLEQLKTQYSNHERKTTMKKPKTITLPLPTANATKELTPYLKAKDISPEGITKITLIGGARQSNSRFGEGIDVPCKVGSKEYSWTIKFDSANYRILFERFGGSDLAAWKGIVKVERKEYLGNEYVAVVG